MKTIRVSRRAFGTFIAVAAAGAVLAACGKKGAPLPPSDERSDFPRTYPAPSTYPHPAQGGGDTRQSPPPEQQQPSYDSGVTRSPSPGPANQ
jgi:predicted small lipoprotein YifL